jgi:ferredoxin
MDVRIDIDPDLCIGYGECVAEDADAVALDAHGCAHPTIEYLSVERAERLCAACPTGAICLIEPAGRNAA